MGGVWCLFVGRISSRWGWGCFGGVWRGFFGRWCLLCGCSVSLLLEEHFFCWVDAVWGVPELLGVGGVGFLAVVCER